MKKESPLDQQKIPTGQEKFVDTSIRKGGTRKIGEYPEIKRCLYPEHMPAKHIVLKPGVYEHICPSCGREENFIIPKSKTF